jgi:hypothetical protein
MTARLHEATLDHALQIARDVDLEGPGPLLSPDVVTWLARLALHHPQVSAAVAAALPSSGVRWGSVWSVSDERTAPDGEVLGWVRDLSDGEGFGPWNWQARHPTLGYEAGRALEQDAARAEVDERLIAAGYTLLGAVYRRAKVAPAPPETDDEGDVTDEDDESVFMFAARRRWARTEPGMRPCPMCGGDGMAFDGHPDCSTCGGSGEVLRG